MPEFEMALWHPSIELPKLLEFVKLKPRIAMSAGDVDQKNKWVHDRTYGRFALQNSWVEPNFDPCEIVDNFSQLLQTDEFINGGRAIIYVKIYGEDVEVLFGKRAMSILSSLGIEITMR